MLAFFIGLNWRARILSDIAQLMLT